jgi:hypothetical protein
MVRRRRQGAVLVELPRNQFLSPNPFPRHLATTFLPNQASSYTLPGSVPVPGSLHRISPLLRHTSTAPCLPASVSGNSQMDKATSFYGRNVSQTRVRRYGSYHKKSSRSVCECYCLIHNIIIIIIRTATITITNGTTSHRKDSVTRRHGLARHFDTRSGLRTARLYYQQTEFPLEARFGRITGRYHEMSIVPALHCRRSKMFPLQQQIGNSVALAAALQALTGTNESPALTELQALTATPGADHQYWHADTIPKGSAMCFADSFHSLYTVLIPLQDTAAWQGSTAVCPGSHRRYYTPACSDLNVTMALLLLQTMGHPQQHHPQQLADFQ